MRLVDRVILLGAMFNGVRMLTGATSVLFLASKGITLAEIGALKSSQAVVLMLADFPLALSAKYLGRRTNVMMSLLLAVAWLVVTAEGFSFSALLFAEVCNALSICLFNNAYQAELACQAQADAVDGRKYLGKSDQICFAVMAFFSLFGGSVSPDSGFLWRLSGFLMLALSAFAPIIWKKQPPALRKAPITKKTLAATVYEDIRDLYQMFVTERRLAIFSMCSVVLLLCYQLLIQFWQLIPQQSDFFKTDSWLYGPMLTLLLLSQAFSGFWIGRARSDTRRLLLIAASLLFVSSAVGMATEYFGETLAVMALPVVFFALRGLTGLVDVEILRDQPQDKLSALLSVRSTLSRKLSVMFLPLCGYSITQCGPSVLFVVTLLLSSSLAAILFLQGRVKSPLKRATVL